MARTHRTRTRTAGLPLIAAALAVALVAPATQRACADEPRTHEEAGRPPQRNTPVTRPGPVPMAPGPAARPGATPAPRAFVDGRGQVMDGRYNHGRFYAPVGTVARTLPGEYRPYYFRGSPYYFSGGAWYAPRAGGFVVIAPPIGLVIAALPAYYSTVWIGGVPYYYADNVYYSWQPDQNGYAVVPSPDGAGDAPPPDGDPSQMSAAAPPPSAAQSDLIIYPKNGQSKDQQAADQYECNNWAKGQTGFDPTQPDGGVGAADADRTHGNYDRAMAACLTGRGYQVN